MLKIKSNLDFPAALHRSAEGFYREKLKPLAAQAEQQIRESAPWRDRTGDARKGLRAEAFIEGKEAGIKFMHTKEYGVYLETANDNKYAVLEPAARALSPIVADAARKWFNI